MSQFVGFGEGCDVRAGGVWCLQQSASFLPSFLPSPHLLPMVAQLSIARGVHSIAVSTAA